MMMAQTKPRTIGEFLCDLLGLDEREMARRVRLSGWEVDRFKARNRTEGWRERFDADVAAGEVAEAKRREVNAFGEVMQTGPEALVRFDVDRLLSMIPDPTLRALAENYDPEEHGGRLVLGPTGIGKSVAAAAFVRRLIAAEMRERVRGPDVDDNGRHWVFDGPPSRVWVRALDLPNARLQIGLGKGEAMLVQKAQQASFAVLDDMGWESRRAGADDVVCEVLAARYDRGLPTYVTSGLTLDAFVARYGDAVVRRICETAGLAGKVLELWPEAQG